MKRIVQSLAVIAIAVGAFAFIPKADVYCLYEIDANTCRLLDRPTSYIIQTGSGNRHITDEDVNGECPLNINWNLCNKRIPYTVD